MAIDGSFSIHSSLRRFLDRCPKLQTFPEFDSLAQEGLFVTEDKVVNMLVGVFLHPRYTIPLMGCFRPIARNFVDKAVAELHLVENLRSNTKEITLEDDSDRVLDEVTDVIELYRHGRGLDLHELACRAFCRVLDMNPLLLSSVLSYFEFAPPPFQRIFANQVTVETCELLVSRISCRLLLAQPEIFSKLWDWSCFMDVVKDTQKPDLKWCGVQILGVVLKLGDRAKESLNVGDEEAFQCQLRWKEFCQDTSLEKASWYVEPVTYHVSGSPEQSMDFNREIYSQGLNSQSSSSPKFHVLQPPFRRQRMATGDGISESNTFILTSSLKKSQERVSLAVSQKWPVLLYGPSGSGKSALIAKLAQDSGNRVLSIQMDDQIDGRTLVGGYVCADRPGEFRWQPGSLTQAVQNGLWIVFEDINNAPSDVHSILMPLLEGAGSFVTGHGEVIRVAESFRMFSTIAVSNLDTSDSAGRDSLSVLWRRVMIRPPDNKDLHEILKERFPGLELLVDKLIETFERVNSISMLQNAGFHFGSSASVDCHRRFSLRDLLKWCKRIGGLGFCFDGSLSENGLSCVYKEAVDVFAAFSTSSQNRLSIMKEIAKLWKVPVSAAETLYPLDKPILQGSGTNLTIGRVSLQYSEKPLDEHIRPFVKMRCSLHVLERLACSVKYNEPVLLVGETGTGKTAIVQNLASRLGQKLTVLNLSQQSDVADLLGGFKPVDPKFVYSPLYNEFVKLFRKTLPFKDNAKFLNELEKYFCDKNWGMLLKGFQKGLKIADLTITGPSRKRKRLIDEGIIHEWERFSVMLESACQSNPSSGMMFSFVEGSFLTALRKGEWILLDELNLAPPETLQRIIGVLEGENGTVCLAERGDIDYICRHQNFRIFACMNPATDAGKRDLPFSLRSRFTEYFVDDVLDDDDLSLFISSQLINGGNKDQQLVNKIVCFYKQSKKESEERLQDGANQKPQYSLRSLFRSLEYTREAERKFGFQKALYDGFSMFFLTMLDGPSTEIMRQKILSLLLGGHMPPVDSHLTFKSDGGYILTKSVKEHLQNLARAVLIKRYPVLLQGPTSSGKTSLVHYLAQKTGHEFVRINNHEHTDLQEYLGSYITDASGKLVFNEGVLVKAVRNGYWIVLDELNLAPSDVLEALNRLLDDNRELFVPELQETIQAHPDFMLFATQNPPTLYGGRKMLSRAFRNRFVEIHVGEIPDDELRTIVAKRCEIPDSYAEKMVEVMKELQSNRQSSRDDRVFVGKHGFITPRDLFRWANRYKRFGDSYEDLAKDGYYLLVERLRDEHEKSVVQEVLRVKLNIKNLYDQMSYKMNICSKGSDSLPSVIFTKSMQRLYFLVERCFKLREPVLLVGETGGGKTTVCQLLSACLGMKLHILNCHQYTETSDFIGGFRPVRERSRLISNYKEVIEQLKQLKAFAHFPDGPLVSSDIDQAASTLDLLNSMVGKYKKGQVQSPDVSSEDLHEFEKSKLELDVLHQQWQSIFVWQDGPLVKAMREGDLFLVDEISLADDSVLERLNSVLEPERMLSLAEKGGSDLEKVTAHSNFFVLATMNPGGDYGKKELSPALRNRFTEIWVPPVSDLDELRDIALTRISKFKDVGNLDPAYHERLLLIVNTMMSFWEWFNQLHPGRMLTVRDLISWIAFFDATEESLGPEYALLHGVFLVLLDGLSLGTGISKRDSEELRETCLSFLLQKLRVNESLHSKLSRMENYGWGEFGVVEDALHIDDNNGRDDLFGIGPFYINKGFGSCEDGWFEFNAPTTHKNALRVLRALQLPKPVLLEGGPGVGKTSLVIALGKCSGHRVVRINLSEQTDMMDLLGSDLPVESDEGIMFSWSDGILLQALKEGCWVLLDELNLAPQSVLEGLNAILDHRAEVFIPELGNTYKCPPSFRVFACQNPSHQGGGRKGLPRSFLNRFTKVYVDELGDEDYLSICESKFPTIPRPLLSKLILFNKRMHEETMLNHRFAKDGFPWEFNLRDIFRSCEIIEGSPKHLGTYSFLNIVYIQRMRTVADRKEVLHLFTDVFGETPSINPYPRVQLNSNHLVVGNITIKRNLVKLYAPSSSKLLILPEIRQSLEAAALCVERQWLCILIGPSCSGKTSLIRLLANLTSNVLNEINLSSATDISELLGSFEQYDALRNFDYVVAQVENFVNEYSNLQMEASKEALFWERDLYRKWAAFLSGLKFDSLAASASDYFENWKRIVCSLCLLEEIIEQLKWNVEKNSLPLSYSIKDLDLVLKTILKLKDQKKLISTKFEWVPGVLIKAIERGEWIILENANLCNPTVLDRINSLVESHGSIVVNERGIVDGNALVLHPHPNFRIFLTVNPHFGEVSRAMRNRGVEIFMMQPYWALNDTGGSNWEDNELKDVKRFLILSGIPVTQLVDSMAGAHIYAKKEGSEINVHITYLELSHWVHLFQKLLMTGCRPIWSLQTSWEHIYLSSLGEVEGEKIINFAKTEYLSETNLAGYDCSVACPLGLPGGWPVPLRLEDFTFYSKEACIRQNCMYLEFLGSQYAAQEYQIKYSTASLQTAGDYGRACFIDMKTLREIMFPKASNVANADCERATEIDLKLTNKMLSFAANWAIEQATESDFKYYLLWFSWFNSQLQPFCQFFHYFHMHLEKMIKHPIWKYIASRGEVDFDLQLTPILSLDFVDVVASNSKTYYICNAIRCIDPLRLTYELRNSEREHSFSNQEYLPLLESLRVLEDEFLKKLVTSSPKLVESSSFDYLIQSYTDLIEDHVLFWHHLISSEFDLSIISRHSLVKDARKLMNICPEAVDNFMMKSKKLDKFSFPEKSLLWIHGGHPFLPSSSNLHVKQHQLLNFVESFWPRKTAFSNEGLLSSHLLDVVASFDRDLRFHVMQGVSMSSFVMEKCGHEDDDVHIVKELEEMYQMLLRRFEFEKKKLEMSTGYKGLSSIIESWDVCCSFTPEMLCQKSVFEGWQDTLPPVDCSSLFWDMELLQVLTSVHWDDLKGLHQDINRLANHLDHALKFSLSFSSRPPQMFAPHQKILWTLCAWTSVDAGDRKIASFILEMWLKWHESLWGCFPDFVKTFSKIEGFDTSSIPLPHILIQPVNTSTVLQITQSTHAIKDFMVQCLKSRVTMSNLWLCSRSGVDLPHFLLSSARSLFQQIIYAHKKSFDTVQLARIRSIFSSFDNDMAKEERIDLVCSLGTLVASSRHHRLKHSVDKFILPLLRGLYLQSNTADLSYIGCVWVWNGRLRIHLLLSCYDVDPAMKYYCKYSQTVETISSLELEIKVRKECGYLAGQFSTGEADKRKAKRLDKLKADSTRLQRKIVFRPEPWKYKKLMNECDEFLKQVAALEDLVSGIKAREMQQVVDQARNWQETAMRFINRLTGEYTAFNDIIQPIQVAVFEMKFGLSLILSSALEKQYLSKVGQESTSLDMETIYTIMRFPRAASCKFISVESDTEADMHPSYRLDCRTGFYVADIGLMERLTALSSGIVADKKVSMLKYRASVCRNILVQLAHSISFGKIIDNETYMLLHKIFDEFTRLWMSMKDYVKSKSDSDSQQYKFKPRVFQLESVIEVEIPLLPNSNATDTFSEWKQFSSEEKSSDKMELSKECESLDEEWKQLEDSILSNVVLIHHQLFGSGDLVQTPGTFHVSDADRLLSFSDSYNLGIDLMRAVHSILPRLDVKLMPEHLFYLSLDYRRKFLSSHTSAIRYNFYKDSNASEMGKMLKVLAPLQQQILSVLNEWEDHNDLRKILDVIEMLLTLPSDIPLAKAFSGLQFLLHKTQLMQENGSKFSFSDQLKSVFHLLSSWQKIEVSTWPGLLDEVMDQYEHNAGKLWFPLFSVLQTSSSSAQSIFQSLEDFIHTSSIGEFGRRLQLLFAFLGQNNISTWLETNSSPCQIEQSTFLYNIFGFYVQFLPIVLKYIDASKKEIEIELKELQRICRWDDGKSYLSNENMKKSRQKLKKLIQKYTDILQEPVLIFLNQEAAQRGAKAQSFHGHKLIYEVINKGLVSGVLDLTVFTDENRSLWFENCGKGLDRALQNLQLEKNVLYLHYENDEDIRSILRPCDDSWHNLDLKGWKAMWHMIENIYFTAVGCGDIWKEEKKSQGKRTALSVLLKLLESSGLSRHKSTYEEDEHKPWWFLQLSGSIQHLLLKNSKLPCVTSKITAGSEDKNVPEESLLTEWKTAIEHYFKSVVSVLFVQQISLNPHKDITLEQVDRSNSFLNQLIQMQKRQLAAASAFDKQLKCLRECVSTLGNLFKCSLSTDDNTIYICSVIPKQLATYKCMWQQKQLFDSLCAVSHEELLLLRILQNSHLNTCQQPRPSASQMIPSFEEFLPLFLKSKESLDCYLIGETQAVTAVSSSSHFFIVNQEMEQLLSENFKVIKDFQDHFLGIWEHDLDRCTVKEVLVHHIQEIFEKAKLIEEELTSAKMALSVPMDSVKKDRFNEGSVDLNTGFDEALLSAYQHIANVLQNLCFPSNSPIGEESIVNLASWELLFDSFVANLSLDILYEKLSKTVALGEKLVNHNDNKINSYSCKVGARFRDLHIFMDLLLNFSDELLKNFLAVHRSVSVTTLVTADILASLFSKGFGSSTENQEDDGTLDTSEDACGTGMGEGVGLKDVSDQINDEDQLLGTRDQQNEKQDDSKEVPSSNNTGVEMEQDFSTDAVSLSEDSGEDEDIGGENEELESEMGPTGPDGEAVDEKVWDKSEDETPNDTREKYESGPSVRDRDGSTKELRAKDDATTDEPGDGNYDEGDAQNDEVASQDDTGDGENGEELNMDIEAPRSDPTGLKPNELEQTSDMDMDLDVKEDEDLMEDGDPEGKSDSAEIENVEGNKVEEPGLPDDIMEEAHTEVDVSSDKDDLGQGQQDNAEMNLMEQKKDSSESSNLVNEHFSTVQSASQSKVDWQTSSYENVAAEPNLSNSHHDNNNPALLGGFPSNSMSEADLKMSDPSNTGGFSENQPKSRLPQQEHSFIQENQPNPYRSIGDALEDWKESVRISSDLQENNTQEQGEMEVDEADEYGYVSEFEKGTAQALGPASLEQVDKNIDGDKLDKDCLAGEKDAELQLDNRKSEIDSVSNSSLLPKNENRKQMRMSDIEKSQDEGSTKPVSSECINPENRSGDLVSFRKSYISENADKQRQLSVDNNDLANRDPCDSANCVIEDATALWRRYEHSTTQLSQELAEQLRLVMEPTVANRLQGDYRTGKRINMKKVIQFIASHYRKDKIWLRRTRPNKRDYQVVIAVDDSLSMSESYCSDVAIEALVTVCRAVCQLEMGNLAVLSFGTKGNIKLLHDFDRPFNREAGVKMISNLTFKQENTIADEPVVDLLKYLATKLDVAVAKARLPSGNNPLQQLALIIADGRFHEKEKLKRHIRDLSTGNRMVVFLLLDNSPESIMDLMEASFEGGVMRFSKYMDSFPFPYYIVLRNIEALPRTLANLLRQWMDLVQHSMGMC